MIERKVESGEWCEGGGIKSPENLLVSGLGFLSVPSQAVAGLQASHVAAAARADADGLKTVFILGAIIQGRRDFGEGSTKSDSHLRGDYHFG